MTKSSAKPDDGEHPRAALPETDTGGALAKYREKRDPSRTNEPFTSERIASAVALRKGAFVVHLHDARRRHFDVRIEVGGVLKSFAVPKGPTLDPREKRLAVHTEDHPLEYADFEEVIPAGNYGAGPMIAWDMGRVQYLEPPDEGLEKGKLDFLLSGFKLRGRFALVRTGDRASRKGDGDARQWLLIKKEDAYSSTVRDLTAEEPESVLSGLTVERLADREQIARELTDRAASLGAPLSDVDPRALVPMLCGDAEARLDESDRLYELKLDGVRLLAGRKGSDVTLVYRSKRVVTATYPEVARAVRALAAERVVLDGEVVAFDESGKPSFQRLGQRMHVTRPHDVRHAMAEVPVVYLAFDLLWIGGRDVRALPLRTRKELLARIVPRRGIIRLLDHLEGDGRPLWDLCRAAGLEGLVAKKADSPYRPGPTRTDHWIKIKREREADFVVTGYVEGNGGRSPLGALELGSYDHGKLVYRGRVGSGLTESAIRILLERLTPLAVPESAASGAPARSVGQRHFVRPELVVSVSFTGYTEEENLRHPVFRGIREDIPVDACVAAPPPREPLAAPAGPSDAGVPTPPAARSGRVKVSNRSKIFWPDEGYTKGELVDYYASIADVMLPFLRDRPIVLVRYPDGIQGKHFYQWNVPEGTPQWIRTLHLPDDDGPGKHTFLVDDVDGLVHVANLGCIPIHVLPFRKGSENACDYFVVDFDLGPRAFSDAVMLALSLRDLLESVGLVGFPKTSGQSGLHVLVPLGAGVGFDTAKMLVELVGRLLQAEHPDMSTMERRIAERGERVFIDVGQTGRSRTIVAPYSVRAHPGALVSLPLAWSDVHRALDPREFSMFNVRARVESRGDPLAGFFEISPNIANVVERLGKKLGARA